MKYIIYKDKLGYIHPVIFPEHVTHATVIVDGIEGIKPISAGFFVIDKGVVRVFGKSESMNLEPREIDREYIIRTINNWGIYGFEEVGVQSSTS